MLPDSMPISKTISSDLSAHRARRDSPAKGVDYNTRIIRLEVGTPADVVIRADERHIRLVEIMKLGFVASQYGQRHAASTSALFQFGAVHIARP